MSKSADVVLVAMTGDWVDYVVTSENLIIIQARTAVDIQVRFTPGNSGIFFSVKSGDQLPLALRNGKEETVSIRGAAGVIVEILRQFKN